MKQTTEIEKKVQEWLDGPYDPKTKEEIKKLQKIHPQKLHDAFFKDIDFGTGGMRGLMGIGPNRMNLYTIRKATEGLGHYAKKKSSKAISAFIGYDVRHHSQEFAKEAALVLANQGIVVYLSKTVCPTPLVSFGCRHFGCTFAIMITASHNPPEYNGYKVYWSHGGQVTYPHDQEIIQHVKKASLPKVDIEKAEKNIHLVDESLENLYVESNLALRQKPNLSKDLSILYTPLHGTGLHMVPKMLKSWGFEKVDLVEEQSTFDGSFPFAKKPNPEEKESLMLGIEKMERTQADLLIATDPDADRIGVVERGKAPLSGNQMAAILLNYLCSSMKDRGLLKPQMKCIKTIVTTELFKKIADKFQIQTLDLLTGFKYIGEKIDDDFLFGAEESYGYLFGTLVRDKDALSTACIVAEALQTYKNQNLTLTDKLHELYERFGVHRESLLNLKFSDSKEGMHQMSSIMKKLRDDPPKQIHDKKVVRAEDFSKGLFDLPPSNVLRYWCDDQTKIVVRPSGTEPKIKVYLEVVKTRNGSLLDQIHTCDQELKLLANVIKEELQ